MQASVALGHNGAGRTRLLGLPVDTEGLRVPADLDAGAHRGGCFLVTFINPNACFVASEHESYPDLLQQFDRVCCDGIGMVLAARLRLRARVPRQSFDTTSVGLSVLEWCRDRGKPVILVGGEPGVAPKAGQVLRENIEGLDVSGAFSGFGAGPAEAREQILRTGGSVVVCGMGAPLQEEYLLALQQAGWQGLGFTCGGFMDQLCERFRYYPRWIDSLNLRFAYRLCKEPRRLARRYLRDYGVFFKRLFCS